MNYFNSEEYQIRGYYVLRAIQKIKDSMECFEELEADIKTGDTKWSYEYVYQENLEQALMACEQISYSIRSAMERFAYPEDDTNSMTNWEIDAYQNMPVEVSYEDEILKIRVPLTVQKENGRETGRINSKFLAKYVKVALERYADEHNLNLSDLFSSPFHQLTVRKYKDFAREKLPDNDNYEMRYITNELMRLLGLVDSARNMSCTSMVKQISEGEECCEVYIFREQLLFEVMNKLCLCEYKKEVNLG